MTRKWVILIFHNFGVTCFIFISRNNEASLFFVNSKNKKRKLFSIETIKYILIENKTL